MRYSVFLPICVFTRRLIATEICRILHPRSDTFWKERKCKTVGTGTAQRYLEGKNSKRTAAHTIQNISYSPDQPLSFERYLEVRPVRHHLLFVSVVSFERSAYPSESHTLLPEDKRPALVCAAILQKNSFKPSPPPGKLWIRDTTPPPPPRAVLSLLPRFSSIGN